MCGIAGFVEFRRQSAVQSRHEPHPAPPCDVIRHRGRTTRAWVDKAWTRCGGCIIDLSTDISRSTTRMHRLDRLNGEIYNLGAGVGELEAAGHRFLYVNRHRGDRARLRARGTAPFRLRGMFGLAIWDVRSRTLVVARDRIGIKPMHYAEDRRVGAVAARSADPPRSDMDAVDHYLVPLHAP